MEAVDKLKILCISDTHGLHMELTQYIKEYDSIDLILFSGDMCSGGSEIEVRNFLNWFSSLDNCKEKVFIPGNHDFFFEKTPSNFVKDVIPGNIHYLNDSGVTLFGKKIWGCPITPRFFDWAFMGDERKQKDHYDLIPLDTDILLCHGPIFEHQDRTIHNINAGSKVLADRVKEVNPELFVFGHIHEARGVDNINNTISVNASSLTWGGVKPPILIEY